MTATPSVFRGLRTTGRLLLLCCLLAALSACVKGTSPQDASRTAASDTALAYGISLNPPAGWNVVQKVTNKTAPRSALDARRRANESILLYAVAGPPSAGLEPSIGVLLVNEPNNMLPRDSAARLTPEQFATIAKTMMATDNSKSKKNRDGIKVMDAQVSRETVDGNMAIYRRLAVKTQTGMIVTVQDWDVYLPDGAGILVKSYTDPQVSGQSEQVAQAVRAMRIGK